MRIGARQNDCLRVSPQALFVWLFSRIFKKYECGRIWVKSMKNYDVIIIGAGVAGCAAARELARQDRKIAVIEKCQDVCEGTSKANSAIVHAGFDAEPGTLKAKLNAQGSRMMEDLSKELDFSYRRNGSMVLCFEEANREKLDLLLKKGNENGIPELKILDGEEVRKLEPSISQEVCAALYAPTGAIVCPFEMTIAFAENAYENGVEFYFETEVMSITKDGGCQGYRLMTGRGEFTAPIIINAAGVYADVFHNMVSGNKIHITPRKGEYVLLDKAAGTVVSHTIFQLPGNFGKGVLVTPTVHGNLLVGPTAYDIEDRDGVNTTQEGLDTVIVKGRKSVPAIPVRQTITSFAGLRAHEDRDDFIIGECEDASGFFDVAGIESPGLSSAPAIGVYVAGLVMKRFPAGMKEHFKAGRKGVVHMASLSAEEQHKLIQKDPAYANVICRCEMVTEGEILDAVRRPLGAKTLDGVKRRTRAGMGRCQAGFCTPKTMDILAREWNMEPEDITKCGGGSVILTGRTGESYEV